MAAKQRPAAVATPDPLDDTPGHRSAFHGLSDSKLGAIPAHGAFRQVQLAEENSTSLVHPRDHCRVFVRHEIPQHLGSAHRPHAARVAEVFHGNRHTVQRASVLAGVDLALGLGRRGHCLAFHHRGETLEVGIDASNAIEQMSRQCDRGDRA
jgi:hypothetical protein